MITYIFSLFLQKSFSLGMDNLKLIALISKLSNFQIDKFLT
jgi:hypothetical protein